MTWLVPALIVAVTVVLTEVGANLFHKHFMHGRGWGWHESHHVETEGPFEENDLYAVVFAVLGMGLFALGSYVWAPAWWVGAGVCVYGVLYVFVHDGLVHKRWPFRHVPKRGYLRHLYEAHKLHHAVETRDGAVSFGFLFAPPLEALRADLRANRRRAKGRDGPHVDRQVAPGE